MIVELMYQFYCYILSAIMNILYVKSIVIFSTLFQLYSIVLMISRNDKCYITTAKMMMIHVWSVSINPDHFFRRQTFEALITTPKLQRAILQFQNQKLAIRGD